MEPTIIDRGRGPEIAGTRVTVFAVMDYLAYTRSAELIARYLELSIEQVQAALAYIAEHQAHVEAEYQKIVARTGLGNPSWVREARAQSAEELHQRLLKRQASSSIPTTATSQ